MSRFQRAQHAQHASRPRWISANINTSRHELVEDIKFCTKFGTKMQHSHTEHVTKNAKMNSHDVIKQTSETEMGRSLEIKDIFESNCVQRL